MSDEVRGARTAINDLTPEGKIRPESHLVSKLRQFIDLSEEERDCLAQFQRSPDKISAHTTIVEDREPLTRAGVVIDGWAMSYKILGDGRMQVVNFVLPGSFVGLTANVFQHADHSVATLTPCKISWFDPTEVTEIFPKFPRLALAIVWDSAREQSFLMERVSSLGRRSAYERFAHLLVELALLLERRGIHYEKGRVFPITQSIFADALGLSKVHVSRTLRQLRKDGLVEEETKRGVAISDLEGLMRACDYDENYLHQNGVPPESRRLIGAN